MRNGFLPAEYGRCLDSQAVSVDPARQVTLTEWVGQDSPDDAHRLGYSGPVSVVRTVVPVAGRTPLIQQARYRAGWRYDMPLAIWPYAGNAGFGSYFSPSIAISYFRERGFPEPFSPRYWRLLEGSEAMGHDTAAWLDTVVKRQAPSRH